MAKDKRWIKLESAEGSGFSYVKKKSKTTKKKLELKKYDPVLRKHVIFKEKQL
jgi:large subunit ribosomal protein L33